MSDTPTTQTAAVERVHHPYSPSKLQSLEACPCYASKESKVLHERTKAGTKAHAVAESGEDDNTLGDEDAAAAAECLDFVEHHRRLMEEERAREVIAAAPLPNSTTQWNPEDLFPPVLEVKEVYLPVDDEILSDGTRHTTAGYVDHCLINCHRTRAFIADWKFGLWPVEQAKNNLQGIAYVLGLARKFPTINYFDFYFKQPHLQTVSHAAWTRAELPALYLRVQVVVQKAVAARAAITRNDWSAAVCYVPNCNFCGNLGRCPKVSDIMCRVGHKFHPLGIPADITPTALHSARDTRLGLDLAAVATCWADAYKRQTTDRIIRGEAELPPNTVLQQRADREIAKPAEYKAIALRHVTQQQYEDACTVGFGKIETAIKDSAPRGAKKAAVESFNAELETAGAVVKGSPYTFLRTVAEKSEN